jgi:hypothetical protein
VRLGRGTSDRSRGRYRTSVLQLAAYSSVYGLLRMLRSVVFDFGFDIWVRTFDFVLCREDFTLKTSVEEYVDVKFTLNIHKD